jgi:hypothetical protein
MTQLSSDLDSLINKYFVLLQSLPEKEMRHKPSPQKWSKKEIMGHLIDSAQNNIRRFIVAQYDEAPTILYNQDKWVAASNYQEFNTAELLQLWYLLNKQICNILGNPDPLVAKRQCKTDELHSLEWLAEDYIKHLKHHIHQVLDLEPFSY